MESPNDKANRRGSAVSSHLSLEAIATRLAALDAGQAAMNGALGLMLDTLHVQTTMLRKLSEFATADSAPSPLLKTLQGLTAAIMELDASVGDVERKFDGLANVLKVAFGVPFSEASPDHDGLEWPHSPAMDGEGG